MLTASFLGSSLWDQHRARTVPYGPAVIAYTKPDSFRFHVAADIRCTLRTTYPLAKQSRQVYKKDRQFATAQGHYTFGPSHSPQLSKHDKPKDSVTMKQHADETANAAYMRKVRINTTTVIQSSTFLP